MSNPESTPRAIWLNDRALALPRDLREAPLEIVGHPDLTLSPTSFQEGELAADPRVQQGYFAVKLGQVGTEDAPPRSKLQDVLRGPVRVRGLLDSTGDHAETGVQIGGILDDLYGRAAASHAVGIDWAGKSPTLKLWAPTAQNVHLLMWGVSGQGSCRVAARWHDQTGIWTVDGDPSWADAEYLWELDVYTPALQQVARVQVTDPYSTGLTVDSKRSVLVDLSDRRWAPDEWGQHAPAPMRTHAAQTLYELHVRDFSVYDSSVPKGLRGTYAAFALDDTVGVRHLRDLADAGLTSIHLLPTFDIATSSIPEDRATQKTPTIGGVKLHPKNEVALQSVPGFEPAGLAQQEAITLVENQDAFNWGYDPLHWGAPEGSYASPGNQVGGLRTREYREMVLSLHRMGMRVIQDVVYNHTMQNGHDSQSVLDRIVPGYYHRLSREGTVETSTCCPGIATERIMAEKLKVDTLVRWVKDYHIDGFRFDLMGHHSLQNLLAVRAALDVLTVEDDGVDGAAVYLYGEGWDFGEVAGDALFTQAKQGNLVGTGIGAFNDRIRDAVRGGSPMDEDHRLRQGFASGQFTDPNVHAAKNASARQERQSLAWNTEMIMLGLVGSLADYPVPTSNGPVLGRDLRYGPQPAGFAGEPQENVNYVEAHDNETLYDSNVFKLPEGTNMDARVRMHLLANAIVTLGQSPAFLAAGTEILRSKSLDRDSYNSGDWFNGIDWTMRRNTFGTGLPPAGRNRTHWPLMRPYLANPHLRPDESAMRKSRAGILDLLKVRTSSPLFTLGSSAAIKDKVSFPGAGGELPPGILVMLITDDSDPVDEQYKAIVVAFNATPRTWEGAVPAVGERNLHLHPVQVEGEDATVRQSTWMPQNQVLRVPARTVAVLVEPRAS